MLAAEADYATLTVANVKARFELCSCSRRARMPHVSEPPLCQELPKSWQSWLVMCRDVEPRSLGVSDGRKAFMSAVGDAT